MKKAQWITQRWKRGGPFRQIYKGKAHIIDQRSQGNETTSDHLRELMQQVYELDKPMEVFRFLNPPLFSGYQRARRVGSAGSSKSQSRLAVPAQA